MILAAMPKRPPRVAPRKLIPADLRGARAPHLALEHRQGQLWLCDAIWLLRQQADHSVRLVLADPPYAIGKAVWDVFPSEAVYLDWCDAWLTEVARVLAADGSAYVCGFSEILAEIKARSARRFAGGCRWLVWHYKNKANLGRDWGRSHESILHLRAGKNFVMQVDAVRVPYNAHTRRYPARTQAVSSQYGDGRARDAWQPHPLGAKPRDVLELPIICNGMAEKTEHPTQKPEALIDRLVRASSETNDLVLDPFAGSGTTLVIAARSGRRFIGGDSDPVSVAMARTRLSGP
jgi:site-specific DNA-methyltransferase (adenine-specific)